MSAISPLDYRFRPGWWLRSAHVQSILASLALRKRLLRRHAAAMLAASAAEVLELGGVRLVGYRTPALGGVAATARKQLIVLHGWEGSANSHYVVALAAAARVAGFDVYRLNFRDHGGTTALNEELFHSCRLDEVAAAVCQLAGRQAPGPTFLVGFSLGGNFALRLAVHPQTRSCLRKVVAVCPVIDPAQTMVALENGLWVYRHYFLRAFRQSLRAKAAAFPERYDFGDLARFRTLTATTAFFVERYTAFANLASYLDGYSVTGDVLAGLEVPTWLLAARDDPVIPSSGLAAIAHPHALQITLTDYGGHCGFLEDLHLRSWVNHRILDVLDGH